MYIAVSSVLVGIAMVFSILCFHFNSIFEALAFMGLCSVMTFEIIGVAIMRYENEEEHLARLLKKAGLEMLSFSCFCRDNQGHSYDSMLYFCQKKFIMRDFDANYIVVSYDKITNIFEKDNRLRFTIDNVMYEYSKFDDLKRKAAVKYLRTMCEKKKGLSH